MMDITAVVLMLLGLYVLLTSKHIIKMIIGLNIFEVGLNLLIITIGYNENGVAPILTKNQSVLDFVDPLPQAIVLTAIVIGFGITAVALMVAKKIYAQYGTYDINEIGGKM
jgi:multicomponent Na+:H+ antiporter subunit C